MKKTLLPTHYSLSLTQHFMKIGIDARLPFYQRGGISQYILYLLPALAELAPAGQFVVGQMWKDPESYTPAGRPSFTRHNFFTPCHHRLEKYALTAELVARYPLDVWHSPDFIPPAGGAKRHIITVHDLTFVHYPQFLTAESRRYYLDQITWAVQHADHISADSEHTRQDLLHLLGVPAEKVTTIYLAANPIYQQTVTAADIQTTLAHYQLPAGFILAVGTLEPRKNLPTLLRAYHQLRQEKLLDIPLVLVGRKGWLFEEIFHLIEQLQLQPFVHHLATVPDQQLAHLYHAAGVLVTPSHYEGFGLPALEAQHCGCPVLVSERGSLPEIVGPQGFCLPPDDITAWSEAIRQVCTDTALRQKMIENGRNQAQNFSWPVTAAQTLKLYQNG